MSTPVTPVIAPPAANVIAPPPAPASVEDLIAKIKTPDNNVRGPAWQQAGRFGAAAVKPLAAVMADPDFEAARCARRGLWKVVRVAGLPGKTKAAGVVEKELVTLLADGPVPVRREVLWMLSEIGNKRSIAPVAALLDNPELREDARCVLVRLPGKKALAALQKALPSAPDEFKFALAEALRTRGVEVAAYPSKKLVPTKHTAVTPQKKPDNA